jgi:pimeloyl-ACP methyl ester carboxylesterase
MNGNSRKYWILLFVALAAVLFGSLLAAFVNTNGGSVKVKDVRFVGNGGDILRGLLYIPKGVTKENPGPAVLVIGGGDSTSDQFSALSVEYARRGYVVFNFDKRGEGFSEGLGFNAGNTGYGGPEALAYLRTLDIVDPKRISMAGHSQGGSAIVAAALKYPDSYVSLMVIGSTNPVEDKTADPSILRNAGYICGTDDRCRYDTANAERYLGLKLASMTPGQTYGSISAGTGRALYYVPVQHNAQAFWPESLEYITGWIQQTNPAPNNIPATNLVFLWRFLGTTIALVGTIFLMFPLGALLLRTSFFKTLVEPVPDFKGAKGKAWWIAAFLTAAIPVITLFKFHAWGVKLLPPTQLFPMGRISGLMFWAVLNALITVIFLLVNHYVLKGDAGATGVNYGLTWPGKGLDWGKIGKSVLLAICLIVGAYVVVAVIYWWLKIDFRIWTVFLRPLTPLRFGITLQYVIPFFLFTLAFGASLHGLLRPKNGTMSFGRELIVNLAVVAPWFLLLQIAYYGPLQFGYVGVPFSGGQMRHFITSLPAVMTALGCISTYFYHKTGRVYVGSTLNAFLVSWYLISGNVITIPL